MLHYLRLHLGFPCGSAGKESARSAGNLGSIPGLGKSPGKGTSYPLQYSGLENSMDCTVHRIAKSRTRLSNFHFSLYWQAGFRFLQLVQRQDSGLHVLFGQGSDITAYNHCLLILHVTGAWGVCPEITLLSFRRGLFSRR